MDAITETGLLRFITAGSVDDGKSTLIGRLLHDSRNLLADQVTALEAASRRRGFARPDLSLLTDGLLAEREQGITIDVAYRYFATPARKFIVGDSPGHVQYTRNMVTAASTADVAVLLVDARQGLQVQTRRHAYLASWVGIPRLALAVNKMDAVDWSRERFEEIAAEFRDLTSALGQDVVTVLPISALHGDMVVERGEHLDWYTGPTLMQYLETVPARHDRAGGAFRLPVQRVARGAAGGNASGGARGYQGTVAAGRVAVGDEVTVLPSGLTARVASILVVDRPADAARADMAVTIRLDRELDVSRGDVIASAVALPRVTQDLVAELCWFDAEPSDLSRPYLLKQATSTVKAKLTAIEHVVDVDTTRPMPAPASLAMNAIARVKLRTQRPLSVDPYTVNRVTGAFILIDPASHRTVAAGTVG
ncbi:MAG: sulfate adenylyltransferase [Betaproteobacteria bacterium]|nr:sulfate adenylyltransferase [Betaproteobacteria bacterium]